LLETALQVDPDFPAARNRLGYLYLDSSHPDPAKAVASLKRYAEVAPASPNPQDSLGEVLREAGDDQDSLQRYRAALQIDPAYISSQYGLGNTRTPMGDFAGARQEYDRAIPMAQNLLDELYVKYLKALVYFWEGQGGGRPQSACCPWRGSRGKERAELAISARHGQCRRRAGRRSAFAAGPPAIGGRSGKARKCCGG
jgi:tetratricopeptide (TPR) repeat protein